MTSNPYLLPHITMGGTGYNTNTNLIEILEPEEDAYLACLHPHEALMGSKIHSYVFAGAP